MPIQPELEDFEDLNEPIEGPCIYCGLSTKSSIDSLPVCPFCTDRYRTDRKALKSLEEVQRIITKGWGQ